MTPSSKLRMLGVLAATLVVPQAARAALVFEANAVDLNLANASASTGFTDNVGGITGGVEGTLTETDKTPSGALAITFNGTSAIDLNAFSPDVAGQNGPNFAITMFAVIKPTTVNAVGSIVGGADANPPCYQYRLNGLHQEMLERGVSDEATSAGTVPTAPFSIVEDVLDENTNTNTFYLNGVPEASTSVGGGIYRAFTTLGAAQEVNSGQGASAAGRTEFFSGDIADIQQYNTALTPAQSAVVEAQLVATYITPASVPEPASLGLVAAGAAGLAVRRRRC